MSDTEPPGQQAFENGLQADLEKEYSHHNDLLNRITALEEIAKKPQKDFWDRLNSVSTIIGGALVAFIGIYATDLYDARLKNADQADKDRNAAAVEVQTVEKFFPYLASTDELKKQAAIQIISSLGNPLLAAKIAETFGGAGARKALTNIAISASPQAQPSINNALTELYKVNGQSIGIALIEYMDSDGKVVTKQATLVIISDQGYALTSGRVFRSPTDPNRPDPSKVSVTANIGSRSNPQQVARLIGFDEYGDIALLKLPGTGYTPAKLGAWVFDAELPRSVTIFGFSPSNDLTASTSTVVGSTENKYIILSSALAEGSDGSPIYSSNGDVIGLILNTLSLGGGRESVAITIQSARSLLTTAGLP